MRTIKLAGLLSLLLIAQQAFADEKHTEYDTVMKVVDLFFEAVNTNNAALFKEITLHDALTQSIREQENDIWTIRTRPAAYDFDPANYGPEIFTERYWDPTVLITGHIAIFWAPYDFYIDGKFSHCGIDAMTLLKVDGDWKLGNSSWSVQKKGCAPSPLGPLK